MQERQGDLIALAKAGEFDVIVHGCNCFCTMGAGIAKAIREAFPSAWAADRATAKGDPAKLGTISIGAHTLPDGETLFIVNAYTQFWYGRQHLQVDYDALRKAMIHVRTRFPKARIGMPRIGAGLGGGDWSRIRRIIQDVFAGQEITIVTLP